MWKIFENFRPLPTARCALYAFGLLYMNISISKKNMEKHCYHGAQREAWVTGPGWVGKSRILVSMSNVHNHSRVVSEPRTRTLFLWSY